MRRLVSLGAVACFILAGLAWTPASVSAKPTSAPKAAGIQWGACADPGLASLNAQCGYLTVPLDYAHPGRAKIQLAVSRIRHTTPDAQYQGPMLVNPGGPGGSGLGLAILGQFVPNHAGDSYDWIGFDPRGVGSSKPAISCLPNYFHGDRPPYVPTTKSIQARWIKRSKAYAKACGKDAPELLKHMKTVDAVRDMDRIRVALGAERINFFGFSYGTYLGQVYSTLFPSHMRRLVMDSNVDARGVWYQANLGQDTAFERNIQIWFRWLAKYDSVYHLGKTGFAVQRLFYQQEAALTRHPAGGVVGPDEWDDAFQLAPYYQFFWTDLADVFSSWVHNHDTAKLIAAYENADGPGDDNGYAVYLAVQCTDAKWPPSFRSYARDQWRLDRVAPYFTWNNGWFNAPCLYWPAKAGKPVNVNGHGVRALLIDETLDAATPYSGSLETRRRFPKSSLLAEPGGTTHAGSLGGNACVDNTIARYLATGELPARRSGNRADATCAPLPVPVPEAAAVSATSRAAAAKAQAKAAARPRALLGR